MPSRRSPETPKPATFTCPECGKVYAYTYTTIPCNDRETIECDPPCGATIFDGKTRRVYMRVEEPGPAS